VSFAVPNGLRVRRGELGSDDSYGNNGAFSIPPVIPGRWLWVIASDGLGWEHVSVTVRLDRWGAPTRTPTWEEMCAVKAIFWGPDDTVVQFHPRASEYVNFHPHCLHLWRKDGVDFPTPNPLMVGPRGSVEVPA
jgi:hypothetical protein